MNDAVNSFISTNIYVIIFILFIIIIYWLRSEVEKLVDGLLTIKNLKASLFILLVLMIFLVTNTFYNFVHIDVSLVAPYMVAMSAILASIVAIINIINNNMKNIIDRSDKVIVLTSEGIIKIDILLRKIDVYKDIMLDKRVTKKSMLVGYKVLFDDMLKFLTSENFVKFLTNDNSEIVHKVHDGIFIQKFFNEDVIDEIVKIDKDPKHLQDERNPFFNDEREKGLDKTIQNLEELRKLLIDIRENETKEHQKLYEEQYRR